MAGKRPKLCRYCNQPMRPKGVRKRPHEFDHAQGCPYHRRPRKKEEHGR